MKVAVFSTKYYEREYLNKFNIGDKHQLTFFDAPLNADTINLVAGFDVVCILVNDEIVNIPSFLVKAGDVVSMRAKAKSQGRVQAAIALSEQRQSCEWLTVESSAFKGTLTSYPTLDDMPAYFNVNLVVELYSK